MSKTTIHILEIRLYDTLGMRNYSRPHFIHLQTSVYGYNSYARYNILDMIEIFYRPRFTQEHPPSNVNFWL